MATTGKTKEIIDFFSTPEKPVTNSELLAFRRSDAAGFDEIAALCIAAAKT